MNNYSISGGQPTLTPQQEAWRDRYGSWAIVTGASDGIGKEMARYLAQAGLNLVLVARRQPILDELGTELARTYGVQTSTLALDLADSEASATLISATESMQVGLLVACAGYGTSGPLIESNLAHEMKMLAVNCGAVLALAHHFGQRFARQGRGGIVLMSSLVAFQGVPLAANYAATKAYVQSLSEGLRRELGPLGVDVLASAPGPVASGFAQQANMRMGRAAQADEVARETLQALGRRAVVRPGFLSKFLEGSLSFLPRSGRVWAMGRIMRGMTQHQGARS